MFRSVTVKFKMKWARLNNIIQKYTHSQRRAVKLTRILIIFSFYSYHVISNKSYTNKYKI